MAEKFNLHGKIYREGTSSGGKAVANIYGDILRAGSSSGGKALCNVYQSKIIKEGSSGGGKALCNIYGDKIKEGSSSGGKQIGTMRDIKDAIKNGHGSPMDVAFWYKFIRQCGRVGRLQIKKLRKI